MLWNVPMETTDELLKLMTALEEVHGIEHFPEDMDRPETLD